MYGLLKELPELKEPSRENPALSVEENIRQNLFLNGAEYCLAETALQGQVTNGYIDLIRGALAASVVLKNGEIAQRADQHLEFFDVVASSIDGQGIYSETASSYSLHTISLLGAWGETVLAAGTREENPFDSARLARFSLRYPLDLSLGGRVPFYGDAGPDARRLQEWEFSREAVLAAFRFGVLSADPAIREMARQLLKRYPREQLEGFRFLSTLVLTNSDVAFELIEFCLNHRLALEQLLREVFEGADSYVKQPQLFPESGFAVLTTGGQPVEETGVLFRYGPTRVHGHLDEMNIQYFARGREYSFDPGYYNTHLRFGFTRTTVGHHLVTAEEKNQLKEGSSGGTLLSWAPGKLLQSVEADSPEAYREIPLSRYQRRAALLRIGGEHPVIIDTFWVSGATLYDYSIHGPMHSAFTLESPAVTLPEAGTGSLLDAKVNHGQDLLPTSTIKSHLDKPFYWAAPGAGYGFLGQPRRLPFSGHIKGRWVCHDGTRDTTHWVHSPPKAGEMLLATVSIASRNLDSDYVLVRAKAGRKEVLGYQSVLYLKDDQPPPFRVEPLEGTAKGMKLSLNGTDEEWLYLASPEEEKLHVIEGNRGKFRGREAALRKRGGAPDYMALVGAGMLRADGWALDVKPLLPKGARVLQIERSPLRVALDCEVADTGKLRGAVLRFSGARRPRFFSVVDARQKDGRLEILLDADDDQICTGTIRSWKGNAFEPSIFSGKTASLRDFFDPVTGHPSQERRYVNNGLCDDAPITFYDRSGKVVGESRVKTIAPMESTITIEGPRPGGVDLSYSIHQLVKGMEVSDMPWTEARKEDGEWQLSGPANASISTTSGKR